MEQNSPTMTLYDFPIDVKVRFIEMAQKRGIPVEEVVQGFMEWKLGKPIQASQSNEPEEDVR
jgi:hypothetical protein